MIGDHSYDHMAHNTIGDTPRNAYVGLDSDITWFGQKSIDPATLTLKEAGAAECLTLNIIRGAVTNFSSSKSGFKEDAINFVTNTMWNYIRLPFSNNWRVGPVSHDCYPCTLPASSGK